MNKIEYLKKSPLFAITLGGKELCHSNFWAWLIEIEREGKNPFVEVFFPEFYKEGNSFEKVEREKENRDLTIYFKDDKKNPSCYFIENKLKALATNKQLEDYVSKFKEKYNFKGGIVTGIQNTINCASWKFLSYEDISNSIKNILDSIEIEESNRIIIETYLKDINIISAILSDELEANKDGYIHKNDKLQAIKLDDVFLKYKSSELKAYLNGEIKSEFKSLWGEPEIEVSFNRKNATVDILYHEKKEGKEVGFIGIEIQGKQFRLHGGPRDNKGKYKDKDEFFIDMKKRGYLENYTTKGKIRGKTTSMIKEYCKYDIKKSGGFQIYQYFDLKEGMKYNEILEFVKEELHRLIKIIEDGFSFCK